MARLFERLKPEWHISIDHNRVALVEPSTGISGERVAEPAFSNADRLIIDDQLLEHALVQLIRELFKPRWPGVYPTMKVVHLSRPVAGRERDALRTALLNAGASRVVLPGDG